MVKTGKRECCKIDAIVTVDAKGQILLPKDLREKANINPNDKLAVIGMEQEEAICCIVLMRTDSLGESVKQFLGPIFDQTFGKGSEQNE